MSRALRAALSLFLCVASGGAPAVAREGAPSPEQMMESLIEYATPGPNHDYLKSMAGKWKTVTKAWFGPGEPQTTEGTAEFSVILGGRYVTEKFSGAFMGQSFEGFGLYAYDNYKKEFVGTWADTLGTGLLISRGSLDASGRQLTLRGIYDDPVTGQAQKIRMVTRTMDDGSRIMTMYGEAGDEEMKQMEITYTRM